jgi:hypothetical protein
MPGKTIGITLNTPTRVLWKGRITIEKTGSTHHLKIEPMLSQYDESVDKLVRAQIDNVVKTLNGN